ncbi:hypothetical protein FVE85_5949 [Porphyridium purpureum]|uniref:OTU domain-containing protein n=1 Tax=Porphyridium purpureum TaxID=35688 RepID=A0A5J4Z5U8_PORPP|nr:hypothetical protein FVE85_5949 [Porphyridium purpureum]|eukprot:POR7905..scf295_1
MKHDRAIVRELIITEIMSTSALVRRRDYSACVIVIDESEFHVGICCSTRMNKAIVEGKYYASPPTSRASTAKHERTDSSFSLDSLASRKVVGNVVLSPRSAASSSLEHLSRESSSSSNTSSSFLRSSSGRATTYISQKLAGTKTTPVGMLASTPQKEPRKTGNKAPLSDIAMRDVLTRKWNAQLKENKMRGDQVRLTIKDTENRTLEFRPMHSDGNCGFNAIAAAMTRHGRPIDALGVRTALQRELQTNRLFYRQEARINEAFRYQRASVSTGKLITLVGQNGPNGFWLGSAWGPMEVLAIAKALGVTIELMSFDRNGTQVRSYAKYTYGDAWIGLLFTGKHDHGHFDMLWLDVEADRL